jgi:CHAT domain-containing protein/Tfp pilus assembly protein PilF
VAHNLDAHGKHAAAQPLFEKALAIRRRLLGDGHPNTVTSYNNLAANLNRQGKYAQAQPLFEKALEIRRRRLSNDHRDTAAGFNNLASNLDSQGKFAQAQPLFEQALQIHRRLLGDDHPDTATSFNNLASNLKSQGNFDHAQPLYEKALEIRRRMLGEDHPNTATSYNNLALNLARQGKYAQAQPLYEKALEIDRRVFTDDHPQTANTYNNLAANLRSQGKFAAAQPLYEKAVEIDRRLLGDDHHRTGAKYNNQAGNLNALGKYIEAKVCWLRAVKSLDAARLQVAFTGLERAATERSARVGLACVLARLGQPVEAWQALEADLGRGLLDELAAREDWRLTPGDRARLRELTRALERLDKLAETTPKGLDQARRNKRFDDLKHERALASVALGEFHAKLVSDHGPLAGEVAKLSEIQAALPADSALVTWVDIAPVGPNAADPDGEHWAVVVRSRGIPAWIPITGTGPDGLWLKNDAELAGRVRMELRRSGTGTADLRPLLTKLTTQRIEPLAGALGASADGAESTRRLIVLPSLAMSGIPIEVLLAPDDTVAVSYAPSATVFTYLREQARPDRRAGLLALGDPLYERQTLLAGRSGDQGFASLPGTRYEVEALTRLFKADERPTTVLLETDASEPELDRLAGTGELGKFGFIHLATHGIVDESIPDRSAVILNQTNLPDPLEQALSNKPVFDGRLSVREIQRGWELKAELVTLSACETALGRNEGGEGFVGFTQALLMSGTRSVCLSLWKVDDMATALLMQRFYANLLGRRPELSAPIPKTEALREAKSWLRGLRRSEAMTLIADFSGGIARGKGAKARQPDELVAAVPKGGDNDRPYASPHFWAAFVLVGDPD